MPRLAIIGAILLFASATLTWGAAQRLTAVPAKKPTPLAKPTVVVPDVTGQAFVFAKGTLEDAGFAWNVLGKVRGYSANTVATQAPAAGTKLIDTGAPVVQVTLQRGKYPESGSPEDVSPYLGTEVVPAGVLPAAATPIVPVAPKAAEKKAKPAKQRPNRVPAFVVAGAPKEPLDEITLTERARRLEAWLRAHPRPTSANVEHFLYQHAWIVTGAKFGWSNGAQALRLLVATDRRAQGAWGVGKKSELVAAKTLAEVESRSR